MINKFMQAALEVANSASIAGEVPVGAVVTMKGEIIASGHNLTLAGSDPTAHAEIVVIRKAAALLGSARLLECDLYVTLEPCPMCAQAISFARIRSLYFGASDFKGGAVENGARLYNASTCFHAPEVFGGIMEQECGQLLKQFFEARR
jgi:tRNA(adenine34) deaminase